MNVGQDFKFIITAVNAIGSGSDSDPSADITVAVKPDAPGDPNYLSSTQTSMQFGWKSPVDAGRSNGGVSLLGYKIQWDNGNSEVSSLTDLITINNPSTVSFTINSSTYSIATG